MKHQIKQVDPIWCEITKETAELVKPVLSFTGVYYTQGYYRKERHEYQKHLLTKSKNCYYMLSGHLQRVIAHLGKENVTYEAGEGFPTYKHSSPEPFFEQMRRRMPNFNEKQAEAAIKLINSARAVGKGIIKAPTGVGKTVVGIGLLSCYKDISVLWLCHTKDLMLQAAKEFKANGFTDVGILGDQICEVDKRITIATRQTFINYIEDLGTNYDAVIVDEVHHLSQMKSDYFTILSNLFAPLRFGLTATLPDKEESKLVCEGLIGPVVAALSINEGNELGIIAKPKIKLIRMQKDHAIAEMRKYADVYNFGVVHNEKKNDKIVEIAKSHVDKGDSVLILVTQIDHGTNLMMSAKHINLPIDFVQGSSESDVRMKIKNDLNSKKIKCVIATTVFFEGVNIPELNVIINAVGGKSEIRTLQILGRGLRKTKEKDTLILYDIVDFSHRYLAEHSVDRICVYMDQGWL